MNCAGDRLTATWISPHVGRVTARLLQHPATDLGDHPGLLGHRDEQSRRDQPVLRMAPADQRFDPGELAGARVHLGLVVYLEFVIIDCLAMSRSSVLRAWSRASIPGSKKRSAERPSSLARDMTMPATCSARSAVSASWAT